MTTHACPPVGEAETPCCRRTVFDLPYEDRITAETSLADCSPIRLLATEPRPALPQLAYA